MNNNKPSLSRCLAVLFFSLTLGWSYQHHVPYPLLILVRYFMKHCLTVFHRTTQWTKFSGLPRVFSLPLVLMRWFQASGISLWEKGPMMAERLYVMHPPGISTLGMILGLRCCRCLWRENVYSSVVYQTCKWHIDTDYVFVSYWLVYPSCFHNCFVFLSFFFHSFIIYIFLIYSLTSEIIFSLFLSSSYYLIYFFSILKSYLFSTRCWVCLSVLVKADIAVSASVFPEA